MEERGTWGKPLGVRDRGSLALNRTEVRVLSEGPTEEAERSPVCPDCVSQGLWGRPRPSSGPLGGRTCHMVGKLGHS